MLLEPEVLALVEGLGIAAPVHRVVPPTISPSDLADVVARLGTRQVVVKALGPGLMHKTERGAVEVVPADVDTVRDGLTRMGARLAEEVVEGYLLAAYLEFDARLGGELLVNLRHTPDFGPVVTLGFGGTDTEAVAAGLRPERALVIATPGGPPAARCLEGSLVEELLVASRRGRPPRLPDLAALLPRWLEAAAAWCDGPLDELELNPVAVTPDGLVALDGFARLAGERPPPRPPRPPGGVGALYTPRSIAIVGVSHRANPGHAILRNLLAHGVAPEAITVVKTGRDTIDGCVTVPEVGALAPVDLLILAVPGPRLLEPALAAIDGDAAKAILVVAGGLESTGVAAALRAHLDRRRARDGGGPVVLGGNSLGLRTPALDAMFIPAARLRRHEGTPAPLALVAQSGALLLTLQERLPFAARVAVSAGNQLDVTLGDHLTHLAGVPEVAVVASYVEGFVPGDGRRWLDAAQAFVDTGRTAILYRAGRTAAGQRAASSHTAAFATDARVAEALARAAGVIVANDLDDLEDAIRVAVGLEGRAVGPRLGAMSNAGFEAVAIADHGEGLTLPPWAPDTAARVRAIAATERLGALIATTNPLDVQPTLDDAGVAAIAAAILDDPSVDVGLFGLVPMTPRLRTTADAMGPGDVASALGSLRHDHPKPFVCVVDGGPDYDAFVGALEAEGIPCFRSIDRAVRALGRYVTHRRRRPPRTVNGEL